MTPTNQQGEQKENGFGGCITTLSLFGMYAYAGWIAPTEWRWFVFLTFTVLITVIEILKVQNKKYESSKS
jgi:hypothetical protein